MTYTFSWQHNVAGAVTEWQGAVRAIELGLEDTPWARSHVLYPTLLDADSPILGLDPAGRSVHTPTHEHARARIH